MTRKQYEEYLNDIGCQDANELRSHGGRIPDHCKYGAWIRKHDPIAFEVVLREANR